MANIICVMYVPPVPQRESGTGTAPGTRRGVFGEAETIHVAWAARSVLWAGQVGSKEMGTAEFGPFMISLLAMSRRNRMRGPAGVPSPIPSRWATAGSLGRTSA